MIVPLSNPDITDHERRLVMRVLEGPNLSLGPQLIEFEKIFADYIGSKYAIAVNSGTSGLHLCVKALNLRENDEVITTPFSFVASANCILYERGIPKFVDIDPVTYNIDVNKIEEKITKNTKGILPVHVFGQPCDMDRILEIANQYNLFVIEDTCEAIGAEYQSKASYNEPSYQKVGTFGNCAVFAFYPNKQITTGEGGIIVTDSEQIAKMCRSLRNQGRSDNGKWLLHERLGYNYRMSDINCALGIAQMDRIEEILNKRECVARWYMERLRDIDNIKLPAQPPGKKISWFVFVIQLGKQFDEADRTHIINQLRENGINCNSYFPPIHLQPFYLNMFGYRCGDYPVTEFVAARTIALPFFSNMKEEQVEYVCDNFLKIIKFLKKASRQKKEVVG